MKETFVLLHGSGGGAHSWNAVRRELESWGAEVFAPDLLGYGRSPQPGEDYGIGEEVAHLRREIDGRGFDRFHLVAHSLGAMIALHLLREMTGRISRLTLIDPAIVSILREFHEDDALEMMDGQYQAFNSRLPDRIAAARGFLEFWGGPDAWTRLSPQTQRILETFVPKIRLEMIALREDRTPLDALSGNPPPTSILIGEKTLPPPIATAGHLARALHATVHRIAGAGHMIPQTHPAAIAGFLRETVSAGPSR